MTWSILARFVSGRGGDMIIYPAFFIIPGMVAFAAATSTSHDQWGFMLLPVIVLPAVTGRLRLFLIVAAGILGARLVMGDIDAVAAALHIAGTLLVLIGVAARCPRCTTHIAMRDQRWRGGPRAEWCYICGRSRKRVWPFQYVLKPEVWDGEYHDEGGGPSSVDSIVDWWRDLAYRRWQKRHRHFQ